MPEHEWRGYSAAIESPAAATAEAPRDLATLAGPGHQRRGERFRGDPQVFQPIIEDLRTPTGDR
jgi:hypothetical protein